MVLTSASLPAKRRILAVCVKLFLEQGYKRTTVAEIVQKADVSNSSFQNIFRAKDGVLTELMAFMFGTQFNMARKHTGDAGDSVSCAGYALQLRIGQKGPEAAEIDAKKKALSASRPCPAADRGLSVGAAPCADGCPDVNNQQIERKD